MALNSSDLRRRALAEFRGYREPRPIMDRMQAAGGLVAKALSALGLSERMREAEVMQAWQEIVGDFISSHSKPSKLKEGILYVQVLQPTVHYEMERQRGAIVTKLKTRFGVKTVRDVRFRLG